MFCASPHRCRRTSTVSTSFASSSPSRDLLFSPEDRDQMDLSPEVKRAFHLQSYTPAQAIDGVELIALKRFGDDGGNFTELVRANEGRAEALRDFTVRQVNYSEVEPGVIKAFHVPTRQTDVGYVPPSDRMLGVRLGGRKGARTESMRMRVMLGNGASRRLRMPPGVAHGLRNMAAETGRVIYLTDLHFTAEPSQCDEGRLPWDFAGPDIWEPTKG